MQEVRINGSYRSPSRQSMSTRNDVSCVACGTSISGEPVPLKLKITHGQGKMVESAKALGFTSLSWNIGDVMQAPMHEKCFDFAARVWRLAFVTRALSPRRQPGEAPHPPHSA
jgi:hypothetical protein